MDWSTWMFSFQCARCCARSHCKTSRGRSAATHRHERLPTMVVVHVKLLSRKLQVGTSLQVAELLHELLRKIGRVNAQSSGL